MNTQIYKKNTPSSGKSQNSNFSNSLKRSEVRILPHNIDAEKALLGSLLIRPETIFEIIDILHTKSFYLPKHGIIFDTMIELSSKHIPIDILSVASRIKEKSRLFFTAQMVIVNAMRMNTLQLHTVRYYRREQSAMS